MKYKKFALLALSAGMIVGCGNSGPATPDWSAEFKTFVKENFYGLEVPYFGTSELGNFTYQIHNDYGYAEIFGGELESSEPIKVAAEFLKEKGFVDLLEDYRDDPQYAQYVSEWTYPMEYRFEAEDVGPRYVRIGLNAVLPTEPAAAAADEVTEEEPAEEKRSFYAQVFDPYYYSWFDSYTSDLVSYAFGSIGQETYTPDETIASELVPYLGQATYSVSGLYVDDLEDAIAEIEEDNYLRVFMQDVVREELDAYVDNLESTELHWDVYTYEEHELEPGYLGRLYKLVSPSRYFTIDVYFAEGEAMFLFSLADQAIPQVIKDMEPALFESNEVTAYDFEYFEDEESGASGYSYLELSENAAQPSGESLKSAAAAYSALLADENLNATEVVEFGILSGAEAQGVLDVEDNQVVVYADYQLSGFLPDYSGFTYYFFWGIEVSDWPTYPEELTNEFITAAGASNIHQFFEQEDGTFKFGTDAESEDDVIAVFNAIKSLQGATVLTEYADGIGRVALNENTMAVIELITQTETSETGEAQTYYGYYVTLEAIPNFPDQVVAIADKLGVSKFNFVEDAETGAWVIPANESDTTLWADEKTNLAGVLEALKTIEGIEFNEPEVSDENDEDYGSYYVAGLLDGKLVVLQSVTVGHDESYNGYYSAQIIVCDPKEDDPAVTAFMQAVATAAGLEVEFSQIDGNYYFSSATLESLPGTMEEYAEAIVTALRTALPDAEFTTNIEADSWGDIYLTIVYGDYSIEVGVISYEGYGYSFNFLIKAEVSLVEAEA